VASRKDPRTPNARLLRREATPAEKRLWLQLRQLELPDGHFRRQVPMGPYFADFAHFGSKLVIELDGGQHGMPDIVERDAKRTAYLEAQGFRVLRFWNHEINENLDGVVETIFRAVHSNPTGATPC
jgi:very-short-patch-repair endonuclease